MATYAAALAAALPRVIERDVSFDVFVGAPTATALSAGDDAVPGAMRVHPLGIESGTRRLLWVSVQMGLAARAAGADILHSTTAYLPVWAPCPMVLTVHDLAIYHFPEAFRRFNRTAGKWLFERSVARASALIAVSEATRRDLVELLGVADDRIHVVPEAADARFRQAVPEAEMARVRARYRLDGSYVLAVGTAEPRKNFGRLVAAFLAATQGLARPPRLVVVGDAGWLTAPLHARLAELERAGIVRVTGYVPRADLPALYAGATAFAYPSLYEGFGLPVLEALACGAPVVTSDGSAMAEVAGNAALLVAPQSVEAIAAALRRLLTDPALVRSLRQRAPQRAAAFTWERTARATLAVYTAVYEHAVRAERTTYAVATSGRGR
ncbi:MAG: glycosyltransferase family 4 protein [Ktedonobacterales bacterium]